MAATDAYALIVQAINAGPHHRVLSVQVAFNYRSRAFRVAAIAIAIVVFGLLSISSLFPPKAGLALGRLKSHLPPASSHVAPERKHDRSLVVTFIETFSDLQATFSRKTSFDDTLPPPILPIPWARLVEEFQSKSNSPFQPKAPLPTCPDWLLQSIADAKAARRPRSWIRIWFAKLRRVLLSVLLLRLYARFAWWVGRRGHFFAVLVVLPLAYVACVSSFVDSAYWFGMNLHALYRIL